MFECIYCGAELDDSQKSLEHIFPDALGGAKLPDNLFKTRNVCKFCKVF